MSDAEHRDPDGLRIGGWVPESEIEPETYRGEVDGPRGTPGDAETALLPAVRDNRSVAARLTHPTQELVVGGIWRGGQDNDDGPPRRSAGRIVLGVLAALLGLGAVIAVPLTVRSGPPPQDASAWEYEAGPEVVDETPAVSSTSAAASPQRSTPPATPSPSATPASLVSTAHPSPSPSPTPSPSPSPTPFAPLTMQAEDGVLGWPASTAFPSCASTVKVVRLIGDWPNQSADGTLTFTNLKLAAGTYNLTVHYVMSSDASRDAQIRFIGSTTTTIRENFPAAACMTSKTLQVTVPAGTTAIEFSNSTDRAPSIDKIVLSR